MEVIMSHVRTKLIGVTAAAAAALFVGFTPLAESNDDSMKPIDNPGAYSPSQTNSPGEKGTMEQRSRTDTGTEFVGTGARKEGASSQYCDHWAEQLRQSDGYNIARC
jgi:hypothetical protein